MIVTHLRLTVCTLLIALLPAGCGEAPQSSEEHPDDVAADACEHLANGPIEGLVAAATSSVDLPILDVEHTRFDIELPASGAGSYEGYVRFGADEPGEFWFFADRDVSLELYQDDVALAAEGAQPRSPECPAIGAQAVYDLEAGAYILKLGPASTAAVSVVVIHAGEDH